MDMEAIYQKMKSGVEGSCGVRINDSGDMAVRLYAVAAELSSLWTQAEWIKKQGFPKTASGEFLDGHAEVRNLTRRSAVKASGNLRFEIEQAREQPVSVPKGTVCLNEAGLEFLTDEESVIAAGQTFCLAAATAREAGVFGNVPANGICNMALAPMGIVRCFNPEAFTNGADEETDESLRSRVLESFRRLPNGSNKAFYEAEALDTGGVSAVNVLPKNRGLGTVDLVIAAAEGLPSEILLAKVKERLEKQKEICVDVQVLAPTPISVDVTVQIDPEPGYEISELIQSVKEAIAGMFSGRLLGKRLLLAQLGNVIYGVKGVDNYSITAPTADIAVGACELPLAGTITVTGR